MSDDLLAETPLFQLLDRDEPTTLFSRLQIVQFPSGQVVYNHDEPGGTTYVIAGKPRGEPRPFASRDQPSRTDDAQGT